MKFFTFFKFLAIVGATTIHPSENILCGSYDTPISECGTTNLLDYNMAAAKIVYNRRTVVFYSEADCKGYGGSVQDSIDCLELPFRPRSVFIEC